jgi:ribonuclease P protein component
MKKIYTLKKNYEFNNVLKNGKYFVKKHVIVYIKPNKKKKNFIGIAISNKLCSAVKRNRIKRLIRESYYSVMKDMEQGYDIVFLWNKKTPIEINSFYYIKEEIESIFFEANLIKK